jgi:hypothetical protein
MLLAQKNVQIVAAPRRRVWEAYSGWFRQNRPFFGQSGGLVDDYPENDFATIGATGDQDVLTRSIEQMIGRALAVGVLALLFVIIK